MLIGGWHAALKKCRRVLSECGKDDAREWAEQVIEDLRCSNIATPIVIEFLAGARSSHELELARAFLKKFTVVDKGRILADDWVVARQLAEVIPPSGRPRQLGDCLIKAIVKRLKYDLFTKDQGARESSRRRHAD
jgi:predicted nucleic acid-binding protein